jgi:sterol desaturase/sphingolipid hydroxylase (fatty acid hydroxylase superfamily)
MEIHPLLKPFMLYVCLSLGLVTLSLIRGLQYRLVLLFVGTLIVALFFDFTWLSFTYMSALILVLIAESRFPRQALRRSPSETLTMAVYVLLKRLGGPLALMTLMLVDLHGWSAPWGLSANQCPIWLQSVVALLALDGKQYWLHRGQHRFSVWWKFHRVHHLSTELSAIAHGRTHLIEFVFVQVLSNFLLAKLLGLDSMALLYGYAYPALLISAIWAHANVDVPRGRMPLWAYVISSPNIHGAHHLKTGDRTNFGEILVLWDVIFGTFAVPTEHQRAWQDFGVAGAHPPAGLWREQIFETRDDGSAIQ